MTLPESKLSIPAVIGRVSTENHHLSGVNHTFIAAVPVENTGKYPIYYTSSLYKLNRYAYVSPVGTASATVRALNNHSYSIKESQFINGRISLKNLSILFEFVFDFSDR